MLMVQEWWKWLENEQQQLSGSWGVCSWVRVKQVAQEEILLSTMFVLTAAKPLPLAT
ncbi:hypothetical protein CsSME_00007738 [Camellia sinensis var. sinensis]